MPLFRSPPGTRLYSPCEEEYLPLPPIMKTPHVIGLVVGSVLITIAIQESRISSIRAEAKPKTGQKILARESSAAQTAQATEVSSAPVRTKSLTQEPAAAPRETPNESFAGTARKMWDNPAGKSMMSQGAKMAVAMMYQDFVDGLDLSKEEGDYFKSLLGKEIADQQELGMKMLGATAEERKTLAEELKKRGTETEAEIKKFLNSEEDFKSFTDYKNHLPERQQLDGIRTAMTTKGVPLDADTETKLVDAMYRARTESNAPDLSGPGAMDEMAKGNLVESFEKSWKIQQQALGKDAAKFLNEPQMNAFQEYQKQAKEMQLMGLKMAEQMMDGKKDSAK